MPIRSIAIVVVALGFSLVAISSAEARQRGGQSASAAKAPGKQPGLRMNKPTVVPRQASHRVHSPISVTERGWK